MDFHIKINAQRPHNMGDSVYSSLESDRGRIINSAALRRLQQKTQVFPLERNAAVRSRLTHSLEVQQNGRYIAKTIISQLSQLNKAPELCAELAPALETLVEMACLMHDIGNPAFGHFGEAAINDWFRRYLMEHPNYAHVTREFIDKPQPQLTSLTAKLLHDLCHFEGNAQAIRIVNTLSALNLTYCQTASILKYTRCATEPKPNKQTPNSYLKKKVGYYFSEQAFITELCERLSITPGNRHPAAYIMEAADDIAYCLADIEDAVEKGFISVADLSALLKQAYAQIICTLPAVKPEQQNFMSAVCEQALSHAHNNQANFDTAFFIKLRVGLVHELVNHAANRFVHNLSSVYEGTFNEALLEDNGHHFAITSALKTVAINHVFCHKEVEELELQGYKITSGILHEYKRLLDMSATDFLKVVEKTKLFPIEVRLLNRISSKFIALYKQTIDNFNSEQKQEPIYEFYYRCRLIQDFISGMTDQFAYDTYRTLTVSD